MCKSCAFENPKNRPKGRRSRYTIFHGENYINISFCEFKLPKTNIFRLVFGGTYFGCGPLPVPAGNEAVSVSPTKRYHALRRLPQKVHLRISPNGIADICTREDSETIGITMDIFLFLSSLEARHVIFLCEGHHFVFWGWSSCRQSRI